VSAPRAHGLLALFIVVTTIGTAALASALLLQPFWFDHARTLLVGMPGAVAAAWTTSLSAISARSAVVAKREVRGSLGRRRRTALGASASVAHAGWLGLGLVLANVHHRLPAGAPLSFDEILLLAPEPFRSLLGAALVVAGVGSFACIICSLLLWFLLSPALRGRLFVAVDACLLLATAQLSVFVPLPGADESAVDLLGPTLRLGVTFVFLVRLFLRLLPLALDLIERIDFRTIVAARHLRAKKSGFLAAISLLSILAVSVSSCALTTTLSVMGGFRQDLKRKILGNNAHIVIDRAIDKLASHELIVAAARTDKEVRGVSAYVSGEVMVSSASNLAGAVLRGIDLDHIGEVSELPRNVRSGSLDYLRHPEKLTRGGAQVGHGSSSGTPLPPKVTRQPSADAAPEESVDRLTEALDRMLADTATGNAPRPSSDRRGADTRVRDSSSTRSELPGIVVGQELARSLRLYVGDEVNIVTPLGDLGPTGPMPKSRPFRVAAIFYSGMYEYDMKFVYVTLATAARFLGTGDRVSGVEITVREPDRAPEVAERLAAKIGLSGVRVRAWQELNKNLFGALALEKLAMFIALGVAVLVASFCIVGTLTLMVQEKGREVAVLKAMGARDAAIVGIFVLEGTLIGVLGSALGLALGFGMCFAAEHMGVRLNPEVYYIDRLPVHVDPTEFITVGVAAVLVCLLVTIYPAKLASRLRPVDALRYE
jgi:lipoprotein-releasing system permease protein